MFTVRQRIFTYITNLIQIDCKKEEEGINPLLITSMHPTAVLSVPKYICLFADKNTERPCRPRVSSSLCRDVNIEMRNKRTHSMNIPNVQ